MPSRKHAPCSRHGVSLGVAAPFDDPLAMTLLTLGPREPQGDDVLVKPQPPTEAPEEPESAVLTPTAAQVVALARATPSAAACRRMSTQSSSSTAGARARGRGRASSFSPLQRVEYVEVSSKLRRDGHSLYVVDVYLQRRSERQRLSDCAYSAAGSALSREALDEVMRAERESDYRVEHRFREFVQLRSRLRALVEPSPTHDPTKCADCRELHALGARRQYQALQLRRVFSTERSRRELLANLVNNALDLAARFSDLLEEEEEEQLAGNNEELAPAGCEVRVKAVALVDDFLRKPFSSSLGII